MDSLILLAECVLKNNVFEHMRYFKQLQGTNIRTKFAPPYAILFMGYLAFLKHFFFFLFLLCHPFVIYDIKANPGRSLQHPQNLSSFYIAPLVLCYKKPAI